jgi:single-stranded-DNA-specific exonuclease
MKKFIFLEKRLNEGAKNLKSKILEIKDEQDFDKGIIDSELSFDEVDSLLFSEINKLAPFGVGNHKPIFLFREVKPFSVRKFGKGNDHIEFIFKKRFGQKISAIAFFGVKEKWADKVLENDYNKNIGEKIDLIASVEKSMFRGRPEIRLRVVDVVV